MLSIEIQNEITSQAQEAAELLRTIAQIPSPSRHEEKRAAFCEAWLKEAGCEGVYTDDALNVIYPYCVREDQPVVIFAAHTDVVFPDTDTLPLKEDDARIYCPGVYDDTANLVNLLLTARLLTQRGIRPDGCGIVFVCDAGEEGMGNLKGIRKIFETYAGRVQAFYTFDLTYSETVDRAVGSCRFKVTARTEGGHSYLAFGHENAIQKMAAFIEDLYRITPPQEGSTTYNAGTIEGGTSVNTIAQTCTLLCEYRSDHAAGMRAMDEIFHDLFKKHHLEYEVIGLRPGEELSAASEKKRVRMLDAAEEIIFNRTGVTPRRVSSSTDCNIPLSLDIPAICLGTCMGAGAHTREEYLEKSSLIPGRMIATELVLSYCHD